MEHILRQLPPANEKFESVIISMYAYAHASLDKETVTSASLLPSDKLYEFLRGFYV